jgi:endogenous inhibitor of DNA gyrase (YacG/DUF329 family)
MAKCDYCGTTILFGGKKDANGRFCNQKCQGRGALLALSKQVPEAAVKEQVWKTHQGLCPKCGGSGPVDVYVSHKVWSALLLTSWSSTPQLSCRSCGKKSQWAGAGFSLLLGWWGFPWGLILTPVQIGRNLVGIGKSADASSPSPELEKLVRMTIAANTARTVRPQS